MPFLSNLEMPFWNTLDFGGGGSIVAGGGGSIVARDKLGESKSTSPTLDSMLFKSALESRSISMDDGLFGAVVNSARPTVAPCASPLDERRVLRHDTRLKGGPTLLESRIKERSFNERSAPTLSEPRISERPPSAAVPFPQRKSLQELTNYVSEQTLKMLLEEQRQQTEAMFNDLRKDIFNREHQRGDEPHGTTENGQKQQEQHLETALALDSLRSDLEHSQRSLEKSVRTELNSIRAALKGLLGEHAKLKQDLNTVQSQFQDMDKTLAAVREESKHTTAWCTEFNQLRSNTDELLGQSLVNVQDLRSVVQDLADVSRYQEEKVKKLERNMVVMNKAVVMQHRVEHGKREAMIADRHAMMLEQSSAPRQVRQKAPLPSRDQPGSHAFVEDVMLSLNPGRLLRRAWAPSPIIIPLTDEEEQEERAKRRHARKTPRNGAGVRHHAENPFFSPFEDVAAQESTPFLLEGGS